MPLPILPTTVVGSYSMPGWLERLKTDFHARRISRQDLDEIHDTAVKAAIKDQEMAGIDIITDGELRRDNMIDYFVERLPGVQFDRSAKKFYYDFMTARSWENCRAARSDWPTTCDFCRRIRSVRQKSA